MGKGFYFLWKLHNRVNFCVKEVYFNINELTHSLPITVTYFNLNLLLKRFSFHEFFHSAPEGGLYCNSKYRAILFRII